MLSREAKKEIRFWSRIYREEAIKNAIMDYKDIAQAAIKREGDYFYVKFFRIAPGAEEKVTDEFANYVLAETKKCL